MARKHSNEPAWLSFLNSSYRYYAERLDDPSLLDDPFIFCETWKAYMAVPVGGRRRSGELTLCGPSETGEVDRIIQWLSQWPDLFPNVRVELSDEPDEFPDNVIWGEPIPSLADNASVSECAAHDRECGLLFGYSDRAIGVLGKKWQ